MIDFGSVRLLHRHTTDWVEMQPREHHDAAAHDPERQWVRGQVFECPCGDSYTVLPEERNELQRDRQDR